MLFPVELLAHMEIPIGIEPTLLGLQPRALPLGYGIILVPAVGLEPTRYHYQRILNPPRLPIPPRRHINTERLVW